MKKNFLKIAILFILLCFIVSCEMNPIENNPIKNSRVAMTTFSQILEGDYFGTFYCLRSYGKMSKSELTDRDTSWADFIREIGPTNDAATYFKNSQMIDYCKINNQFYDVINYGGKAEYVNHDPTINLNTTGNVFEWSINNQIYRDTLFYNAPEVVITSPTFLQSIKRNQGLTITWEPSSTENDFVEISLQGVPMSLDTTTHISYYSSGIIDDNGSFTIPSQILSTFVEPKALLAISRGTYKESTHNNKAYLFLIYTGYSIDVMLQ